MQTHILCDTLLNTLSHTVHMCTQYMCVSITLSHTHVCNTRYLIYTHNTSYCTPCVTLYSLYDKSHTTLHSVCVFKHNVQYGLTHILYIKHYDCLYELAILCVHCVTCICMFFMCGVYTVKYCVYLTVYTHCVYTGYLVHTVYTCVIQCTIQSMRYCYSPHIYTIHTITL